ncbi:RHS repeat-associated core domain-containing protein [Marinilabiliaceae bacterium JC017]|nr:RHS repeat-associated core domain-containing protein [Marinilabiliaceae bacterium JC017]
MNGEVLDWYDYGARFYDAALGRFHAIDPLTEKYSFQSGYLYASNNPIMFIDWQGLETRVYTETTKFGHVFVTVGNGSNTVVYSYGRYGELGSAKGPLNFTNTSGEGVLIKWTGQKAQDYISKNLNDYKASVFEISDANENDVANYFDGLLNSSDAVPERRKDKQVDGETSKVIDEYKLGSNNCTTKSIDGVEAGGTSIFSDNKKSYDINGENITVDPSRHFVPVNMEVFLKQLASQAGSGVTDVTEQFRKQYEKEKEKQDE